MYYIKPTVTFVSIDLGIKYRIDYTHWSVHSNKLWNGVATKSLRSDTIVCPQARSGFVTR